MRWDASQNQSESRICPLRVMTGGILTQNQSFFFCSTGSDVMLIWRETCDIRSGGLFQWRGENDTSVINLWHPQNITPNILSSSSWRWTLIGPDWALEANRGCKSNSSSSLQGERHAGIYKVLRETRKSELFSVTLNDPRVFSLTSWSPRWQTLYPALTDLIWTLIKTRLITRLICEMKTAAEHLHPEGEELTSLSPLSLSLSVLVCDCVCV